MKPVKPLVRVIDAFEELPGIGPKTAQRLAYYLLHVPETQLSEFGDALVRLKKDTVLCETCKNVSEKSPCTICTNDERDKASIIVVENPLDILAFEKTGKFKGVYHVLHGSINPLENIGPDEIFLNELIERVVRSREEKPVVDEVIIATNPTMEGEATAMYLTRRLKEKVPANGHTLIITRLGMGIPTGAYLEFADETTLIQAFEGRRDIS